MKACSLARVSQQSIHQIIKPACFTQTIKQSIFLLNQRSFSTSSNKQSNNQDGLMRAAVLTESGAKGTWKMGMERIRIPKPNADEVLIKTRAAGLCRSDLHALLGEVKFPLPAVFGHEISGEVVELGADWQKFTELDIRPGTQVIVPFIMPCGRCAECARGNEEICEKFLFHNRKHGHLYDGKPRLYRTNNESINQYSMGGMSEYCVVPATSVFPLPKSIDVVEAAIIGCSVFTGYGAVRNAADVKAGETVAVIGSGGVGQAAIQWSRVFGASQIIAVDMNEEQLNKMKDIGATHLINAGTEDVTKKIIELTGGRGVDVCIEALGKDVTLGQAFQAVAGCGRAVAVGLAPPNIFAPVEINRLVRRQVRVIGSYGAKARKDMPQILAMIASGQFKLNQGICEKLSLEQASEGYTKLYDGKIKGRAIVDMTL